MERAPVAQRLSKSDAYQSKPSAGPASDYHEHSENPASQRPDMASPVREAAVMNTPPQSASSQLSASTSPAAVSPSLNKASTPPRASVAPAVSGSPISGSGPPVVSPPDVEFTPPHLSTPPNMSSASSPSAPPRLSSPPLMMQGLRPPPSAAAEITPAGSMHLSAGSSSSSLPTSTPKLSTPLSSESMAHQNNSALPPTASVPPTAPISSLEQMVTGSMTSCLPDVSGAQHEKSGAPKLMSASSSVSDTSVSANSSSAGVPPSLMSKSGPSTSKPPGSFLLTSGSPTSVSKTPSVGNKPCDPGPTPQRQTLYTPPAVDSSLSTASAASSPPGGVNLPSLAAQESPTVRPLSTLPLLTTQASRTAPVSAPPALVSVPLAMGTSSGVVQSSESEQHPSNATPPYTPKQPSLKPEHHGHSEDREKMEKPEEFLPQLDTGTVNKPQNVKATETQKSEIGTHKFFTDLPGTPLETTVAPDRKMEHEKHHMQSSVSDISEVEDSMMEQTPLIESPHLHSTRTEYLTDEGSFDNSSHTASRIDASSLLEKTSLLDGDSSCADDYDHFDSSFHLRKDTSQFDSTSKTEEEPFTAFDTTRDSCSSVEDSRDDTLDSTREGETSEAEETKDSCQITGESMLESSLNNTSQMEEPPVDSSDVSISRSFVPSETGPQGNFLKFVVIVVHT